MIDNVVIPAAGLGRRMRSYGPKALLRLGVETILDRQIRLVKEVFPHSDVVVVAGHGGERVARSLGQGVRTVHNDDPENTNVARSAALGMRACGPGGVLVVYGDLVFNRCALEPFASIDPSTSAVLVERGEHRSSEVGVNVVAGLANHFCHGLERRWGQVVYLCPQDRSTFERLALSGRGARLFGYEVLNRLLERCEGFCAVEPSGLALAEVDCSSDLHRARAVASTWS